MIIRPPLCTCRSCIAAGLERALEHCVRGNDAFVARILMNAIRDLHDGSSELDLCRRGNQLRARYFALQAER